MAKLKARDVVKGWPRGKSQSQAWVDTPNDLLWFGRSRWNAEDYADLYLDVSLNASYHIEQSRMLDKHLSEYRRPTAAWLARKIMEYGGGLVIATCGEILGTINLGEPEKPWRFEGGEPSVVDQVEAEYNEMSRRIFSEL